MYLVLDTSALLSGMINSVPTGYAGVLITSGVRDEVGKGIPQRNLQNLLLAGLIVRDPLTLEEARKAARATGDLDRLSVVDMSIIALAIEMERVTVITDDFRVQNVLGSLGIGFLPAGEIGDRTISETWTWTYRCKGCGRYFENAQKRDECPICGSLVRKYRKR